MDNDIFIGRQPIYDKNLNVYAYELLFRAGQQQNAANFVDGDIATTNVVLNALTEIGMDKLVGNQLAFINLTRNFLLTLGDDPVPEIKHQLVMEILEDIAADDEVVAAVQNLSNNGYTIALDDFVYHASLQPLVDNADVIKIDLMALDEKTLSDHVSVLANGKRKLLAEKVETQEEFERCKKLGFDYFQGYFFCKPNIVKGQRAPANKLAVMKVLASLQSPDLDTNELTQTISQDVTLSYRLLRYINSAQFGLGKQIDSIKRAVVMLGRNTIRNLASLIALSQIDDKPHELFVTAMIRAKMAESVSKALKIGDPESCFTIGLFSVIDALMDQPMSSIMEQLPLSDDIKTGLLDHRGAAGYVLDIVGAYERADWNNKLFSGQDVNIIRDCYLEAIKQSSADKDLV